MKKEPKSNLEWIEWGKQDPLFGVAAWPGKEKSGADPWTDEDFYKCGQKDWEIFLAHWIKQGISMESCVEIGCGAGRITQALAKTFEKVIALDVSPEMIDYAQRHIPNQNVHFTTINGSKIPLEDLSVTAVFSTHVFQHFDSPDTVVDFFKESARILKPEGSLMIHLPLCLWPRYRHIFQPLYSMIKQIGAARAAMARKLLKLGFTKPIMRETSYEAEWIFHSLSNTNLSDIRFIIIPTSPRGGLHPFVYARKV